MKTGIPPWSKLPSYSRPGTSFYRATIEDTTWTVTKSRISGFWNVTNNRNGLLAQSDFKTAKQAKARVEQVYRIGH